MKFAPMFLMFALALPVAGQNVLSSTSDGRAPIGDRADDFGAAVLIHGDWAFVGEPQPRFVQANSVFVFQRENDVWVPVDTLSGPERGSGFGSAMAVSGDELLIGAPAADGSGAVYRYTLTASEWTLAGMARPDAAVSGSGFGRRIAADDTAVLVGAPFENANEGAVYAFRVEPGGDWVQEARLEGTVSGESLFGFGLALAGEGAVVGAQYSFSRAGAAYYFRRDASSTQWSLEQEFSGSGVVSGNRFGRSVDGSPDMLVIGAPVFEGGRGRVFHYEYNSSIARWVETGVLAYDGGSSSGFFGWQLSLSDDRLLAGSLGNESALVYRMDAGVWTLEQDLVNPLGSSNGLFGYEVGLSANTALVGALNAEMVYFYERSTPESGLAPAGEWGSESDAPGAISGGRSCVDQLAGGFPCNGVDLLSFLPITDIGGDGGTRLNDVWGWTDPSTGTEYALVGRNDGTAFVDLSNPREPRFVGTLPTRTSTSAWRDIKVVNDHAVIVADAAGSHGMQVFDLTNLRNLSGGPVVFEPTTVYTAFGSAHNVAVNEASGHAIAVGISGAQSVPSGTFCGPGPHLIDMTDPSNPVFAGCYLPGHGRGYSHDVQCVRYNGPDSEHVGKDICVGSDEVGISITDVSTPANAHELSRLGYPSVGYAHQGWLTEDHRYFVLGDELDESQALVTNTRTLLFDVEDLDEPILIGEYIGGSAAIDHNMYTHNGFLYQANYTRGLVVLDLNAESGLTAAGIEEVASFDVFPADDGTSFSGAWSVYPYFESGVVLVSGIESGLFVLQPDLAGITATDDLDDVPSAFKVDVYPNPTTGSATLTIESAESVHIRVAVFDILGREVNKVFEGRSNPGRMSLSVNADTLPAGLYFVRADVDGRVVSTPLAVTR